MRATGIIAEYNPFHNGHLYQINKIRETLRPDLIIVVMSGNFTQRGEPAILSKWSRAEMALAAGVDLVFELPYVYAVGRADTFASGGVALLNALHVSHLVFGSENGEIAPFINSIEQIEMHSSRYQNALAAALSQGISYPNAHAAAYQTVIQGQSGPFADLREPNNSLAFHYIRAIRHGAGTIQPVTFKRQTAAHGDIQFAAETTIASATSIRHVLQTSSDWQLQLRDKLPQASLSILNEQKRQGSLASWERFFPYLKYTLLAAPRGQLQTFYEAEEGIENRLIKWIQSANSFEQFIGAIKTKRYTWVRLQRLCTHILTHTLKNEAKAAAVSAPTYLRLLGMSPVGQRYLSEQRKTIDLPLITKIRRHHPDDLSIDLRAGQIYDFLTARDKTAPSETGHAPLRKGY
ncbi:MAG: nucleotidyltransferase [Sporolactobacillus sp.]